MSGKKLFVIVFLSLSIIIFSSFLAISIVIFDEPFLAYVELTEEYIKITYQEKFNWMHQKSP